MRKRPTVAALLVLAVSVASVSAHAKIYRDPKQVAAFKRQQPCASTGKSRGACPGYVVDHVRPLCAGGPDKPSNMQWQTIQDAKAKDREERKECRK